MVTYFYQFSMLSIGHGNLRLSRVHSCGRDGQSGVNDARGGFESGVRDDPEAIVIRHIGDQLLDAIGINIGVLAGDPSIGVTNLASSHVSICQIVIHWTHWTLTSCLAELMLE